MADWDARFMALAGHVATWSKDPSTQVGCVIVGPHREPRSMGFNGLPRRIEDTHERLHVRELKCELIVHAEENAILHAACVGVPLNGCTAYVTFPPCPKCAASFIQAGIKRVCTPRGLELPERWKGKIVTSLALLREAGVSHSEVLFPGHAV